MLVQILKTYTMYSFFIGCDVSKDTLDIAYQQGSKSIYLGCFSNCHKGFKQLVKGLSKHTIFPKSEWFVGFENTGIYSKQLLEWLHNEGIPCREECPLKIKRSLGLKRGKDDRIDAKAISNYVFEKKEILFLYQFLVTH